jgi:hypothetical protein
MDHVCALFAAKDWMDLADCGFSISVGGFDQFLDIEAFADSASAANIDSKFISHVERSSRHIEKL